MAKKKYRVNRRIKHDGKRYQPKALLAQQAYALVGDGDEGRDVIELDPKSDTALQLLAVGAISDPDAVANSPEDDDPEDEDPEGDDPEDDDGDGFDSDPEPDSTGTANTNGAPPMGEAPKGGAKR